jgi:hypothetical protein
MTTIHCGSGILDVMTRHIQVTRGRTATILWLTGAVAVGGVSAAGVAQAMPNRPGHSATGDESSHSAVRAAATTSTAATETYCARLDAATVKALLAAAEGTSGGTVRLTDGSAVLPLNDVHLAPCPSTSARTTTARPTHRTRTPSPTTSTAPTTRTTAPSVTSSSAPTTSRTTAPPVTSTGS